MPKSGIFTNLRQRPSLCEVCFQRIQFGYSVAFSCSVAFRIEIAIRGNFKVFILSGQIEKEALAELNKLFELETDYRTIVLDLKEVSLVSREVMRFLAQSERDGVNLENCPPYIREWMSRENDADDE